MKNITLDEMLAYIKCVKNAIAASRKSKDTSSGSFEKALLEELKKAERKVGK
jgi:hypothetical protein